MNVKIAAIELLVRFNLFSSKTMVCLCRDGILWGKRANRGKGLDVLYLWGIKEESEVIVGKHRRFS